jgi:peptidoglycan hydrolase-like protein with peptidoglycan-binding domain
MKHVASSNTQGRSPRLTIVVLTLLLALIASMTLVSGCSGSDAEDPAESAETAGTTEDAGSGGGSGNEAASQPSERVKAMQQELKDAGYYAGAIDGVFGPETADAVKSVQVAAGITVDGIYGPQTHDAVVEIIAGQEAAAQAAHVSPHMTLVQQDLQYLGYYEGDIDGTFGSQTEAALKAFQQDNGLTVNGQIDSETDAALSTAMENFAN